MKIKQKIIITDDNNQPFMGIGLIWLLQGIKKYKSINNASKDMNLSYTKAINMLNLLEKNLGKKVITRKHGGNERSGAELTEFGEEFIRRYDSFQKRIKEFGEKEFQEFIKDYIELKDNYNE